jgi:hypothetical protein
MPVIGYLESRSAEPNAARTAAFREGLGEIGYVEGKNVAIEYRCTQCTSYAGKLQLTGIFWQL